MNRSGSFDTDKPTEQRPLAGIALRLVTALLLAAMFALVKLASTRGVHLVETLFYRQIGSALCAVGLVATGPGFSSLRTKRVGAHVVRMSLGMAAMALNFLAMIMLPLAEATAIGFSVPIFSTILAAILLGEPTGRWRWGAVAAGFVGVLVIVQPGSGDMPLAGAAVALVAALMTAAVTIMIRRLGATERASTTVFWFATSSLVPMAILMLCVRAEPRSRHLGDYRRTGACRRACAADVDGRPSSGARRAGHADGLYEPALGYPSRHLAIQ